ncbi:MAG: class I SAM-dependent methyltransferase [candidate division KSB1 bacterium]|nr:class I SAM-dependent methyltransferase [candidate division KSB1 bacterium]MDZ7274365.1 class I SAM-dependent methyltransferase [candidate division KSB1 bacterium]MDZ7284973.1 class I SAM-dependent methyltransferase [candidate division KSB1 bacterium]MDZ7297606.1 class I SAM-dependent methyltransferase [candidate division KSB1 bacterium]MDZ7306346.1 class I SAM-dependent methyltransferase [candidate division KSB1 bacterium]
MLKRLQNVLLHFDPRRQFFRRLRGSQNILDLGCGDGKNCLELREMNPSLQFYGIDLREPEGIPPFIHYHRLDLNTASLPYNNQFFDAILLVHVIEHLDNPAHLGGEIQRLLKPGGMIYIETPNWTTMFLPSFGFYREQGYPFNFFDDHTHKRPWSKQGLFEYVRQDCSLEVEKVATRRNWPKLFFDPLILLCALVGAKRPFVVSCFWNLVGWCIYAIGVKKS